MLESEGYFIPRIPTYPPRVLSAITIHDYFRAVASIQERRPGKAISATRLFLRACQVRPFDTAQPLGRYEPEPVFNLTDTDNRHLIRISRANPEAFNALTHQIIDPTELYGLVQGALDKITQRLDPSYRQGNILPDGLLLPPGYDPHAPEGMGRRGLQAAAFVICNVAATN